MARQHVRHFSLVTAIAFKFTKIISVLKLLKFTKLLVTATTMLISVFAYGLAYGPYFAIAVVSMIFIHEMGHVIAIRRQGFAVPAPVFIPFFGAAIFAPKEVLRERDVEAYVGYGGPLLGSLGAYACLAVWWYTDWSFLLFVAFLGIYLNLFNMIPIRPLDGGRITQALSPYFKYVGLVMLVGYTLFLRQPSLIILWIFVLSEIKLPLYWRPGLAVVLTVAMTMLFAAGYGPEGPDEVNHVPWWLAAIDVGVAVLLTAMTLLSDKQRWDHRRDMIEFNRHRAQVGLPPEPVIDRDLLSDDDRPYPAFAIRLSWLLIYFGSVVLLWFTMAYLVNQIGHH
jgi:Zn-dependent protease